MSFHLYDIREIFSGAGGSQQFIELAVGGANNEDQWSGGVFQVTQGGAVVASFTVPSDLPSSQTANTSVLLATQAFVNATGLAADFIIPEGFLPTSGGTFTVSFVGADAVTYATSALPTNGYQSLVRTSGSVLTSVATAQPKNFAGESLTLQNLNQPPSGTVVVTGTPTEDEVLAADASNLQDADGLGDLSYQWLRGNAVIAGATGTTYTLRDADVGAAIRVRVTYTDDAGTVETVTSAETAAVANVNDAPTGSASIGGSAVQGQMLTAQTGSIADADGLGTFQYQWLRHGVPIGGASAATYLLVQGDVGAGISVRVSYTDDHGTAEQLVSAATGAVANVNDEPTGTVEVDGTPVVGHSLVADTGSLADADGLGAFEYQWLRNGTAIPDADAATYQLAAADVGAAISVRVSYMDGGGTQEELTSAATAAVAAQVNVIDGTPAADDLAGTSGPDEIRGFAGNDTLAGMGGDDQLEGGDGVDTAVLGVALAGVQQASLGESQLDVETAAGRIVMTGIERVQLTDLLVAFDTDVGESVWNAQALLWAALGTAPSQSLLSDWVARGDDLGGSLHALAQALLDLYAPGASSEAVVGHLFTTLLHMTPTEEQVAQFAGLIGPGEAFEDNAAFLAFAAAHEVNTLRFAGFAGSLQVLDPAYF